MTILGVRDRFWGPGVKNDHFDKDFPLGDPKTLGGPLFLAKNTVVLTPQNRVFSSPTLSAPI